MKHKNLAAIVLMSTAALAFSFPGMAETKNKIKDVTVNLSLDSDQEVGESAPDNLETYLSVPDDSNYRITDADWTNSDSEEWDYGSIPTMEVTLEPKNSSYEFKSGLKAHVNSDTKVKSVTAKRNGSDEAVVTIRLKSVGGDLEIPDDLEWRNTYTAAWDSVDGAKSYQVKLYRDGSSVTTVTTSGTSYNFYSSMNRTGDYTFKVKTVANKNSDNSDWSDESDEMEITTANAANGTNNTSPSVTVSNAPGVPSANNLIPGWHEDSHGWFYYYNNRVLTRTWLKDSDGRWYHLNQQGYMDTGWYQDADGRWYYLKPNSGDPKGSMASGWLTVNGKTYYFSETVNGPFGSMVTGNVNISGKQYTFSNAGALVQ